MTHADWIAELSGQLEAHFPECAVVIEDEQGHGYELTDVSFENVEGRDQILVRVAKL